MGTWAGGESRAEARDAEELRRRFEALIAELESRETRERGDGGSDDDEEEEEERKAA